MVTIKNLPEGKTIALGGITGLYFRKGKHQGVFFFRYSDLTGRHNLSIGNYPEMSLAEARDAAEQLRQTRY